MGSIADKIARNQQNAVRRKLGIPPVKAAIEKHRDAHAPQTMRDVSRDEREARQQSTRPSRMEEWEVNQTHSKKKYIVVDHPKAGIIAQTFHGCLIHAEMARASYLREGDVLGAGFYDVFVAANGEVDIRVHGRSESLNIDSRPEDREYIAKQLGLEHFLKD